MVVGGGNCGLSRWKCHKSDVKMVALREIGKEDKRAQKCTKLAISGAIRWSGPMVARAALPEAWWLEVTIDPLKPS